MKIEITREYFIKNNKPYFLISGEIHYFRISAKLWEKHLRMLKDSGANTTSTYIPWDWHEYQEGKYDFSGETHPSRNLLKYIMLCKKIGLDLIVKPGPYILAEYEGQGLPKWFIEKADKNTHAIDEFGDMISPDLMSYLSDEFLSYTFKWYQNLMPIIEKYQIKNGGPIIMMQVCNEVGVFQWLSGKIDYNNSVVRLFRKFLSEKYLTIEKTNSTLGSEYRSFDEIKVPTGIITDRNHYRLYYEFHLFYRHYYYLYIKILIEKIKSFNIELLFTHNIPGWIYGNASELPMLITMYSEIIDRIDGLTFGLDHIPEFFSYRNAHSDLACNKILMALQTKSPIWAAEFQAGSREHQVKSYAKDLESFYLASLAHGLKGFNYYMFSQGKNLNGNGHFGKNFYFQTALDHKGNPQELYSKIKNVNKKINKYGKDFAESVMTADICVGFYKPYFQTEFISSQINREQKLNINKLGLNIDPRLLREEVFFNGALRSFQTLNINYDIKDIENTKIEELLNYKQLWVTSTEYMGENTQKLLADFVKNGGNLVLYPALPYLDLYLRPCTILQDEFSIEFSISRTSHKIKAFLIEDIYTLLKEKQIYSPNKCETIASTSSGETCGIKKSIGKGNLLLFGFAFSYSSDEHLALIKRIVSESGIKTESHLSDIGIQYINRISEKFSYLFLMNYHNEKKSFEIASKKINMKPYSVKVIKIKKC